MNTVIGDASLCTMYYNRVIYRIKYSDKIFAEDCTTHTSYKYVYLYQRVFASLINGFCKKKNQYEREWVRN